MNKKKGQFDISFKNKKETISGSLVNHNCNTISNQIKKIQGMCWLFFPRFLQEKIENVRYYNIPIKRARPFFCFIMNPNDLIISLVRLYAILVGA